MEQELKFATDIAKEAGKIMLRYFRADDIGTIWKEDETPLTLADTTINDMVIDRIQAAYPEHGIHGEERSVNEGREWMWVCDPVDGTMPFSIGLPISTFSLGLTHKGTPQMGVVFDPFSDRLYTATIDQPAMLNEKEIRVNDKNDLKNAYINSDSWAMHGDNDDKVIRMYGMRERLLDAGAKPITPSAFVITGCLVASGDMTGAIFGVTKPEDLAAVKVIVERAGGKVTDIDGNDQPYDRPINGAVASNGLVHEQLLRIAQESRE